MKCAKRALLAAGCDIAEDDPSVTRCYIRDPYGLVFNIEQVAISYPMRASICR